MPELPLGGGRAEIQSQICLNAEEQEKTPAGGTNKTTKTPGNQRLPYLRVSVHWENVSGTGYTLSWAHAYLHAALLPVVASS